MDKAEEKALVPRLARMDEQAWEVFCKEYSLPLLEFVRFSFGASTETAEEVVQMTFVRCVRSIRTFKPSRGRLFGWLKAISRNEAHTLLRADSATVGAVPPSSLAENAADKILDKIDSSPLPEEVLARKDVQLLVQETLVELNSRYRQALIGKYLDNLRVSQLAQRMAASEKAVESVLVRSRGAFRKALLQKLESRQANAGS
ncbi:MAG: RNA polymerase sigma factor [Planctomycetota bacterium]|jgi:RNA polymerase sigma-70 factor (ECF subfamily)